jgi:single-strand DNA-binding protein
MARDLNRITLIGRLGKDPEIRSTNDGRKVASFSLATGESWKDKTTGEKKERTQWHNIVVFNQALAGVVERFLSKGEQIYLEGASETRKYTDKAGVERWTTEVVLDFDGRIQLLGGNQSTRPPPAEPADRDATAKNSQKPAYQSRSADIDDDIPF